MAARVQDARAARQRALELGSRCFGNCNGLTCIERPRRSLHRGRMKERADFYRQLVDLRAVRYFDIEGKLTGLKG